VYRVQKQLQKGDFTAVRLTLRTAALHTEVQVLLDVSPFLICHPSSPKSIFSPTVL
jgi:hypothetical protein